MKMRQLNLAAAVSAVVVMGGLVTAAPASADCIETAGTTVCGQGEVRGGNFNAPAVTTGPFVPYDCGGGYDYYCNEWAFGGGFGGFG